MRTEIWLTVFLGKVQVDVSDVNICMSLCVCVGKIDSQDLFWAFSAGP